MTSPRLSVCLTFDFDALSPWAREMAGGNMAAMSRGEFGAVAVPRILALLERHGVPASFFIPGHTALAYPELVRQIRRSLPTRSARSSGAGSMRSSRWQACGRSATGRRTSMSA